MLLADHVCCKLCDRCTIERRQFLSDARTSDAAGTLIRTLIDRLFTSPFFRVDTLEFYRLENQRRNKPGSQNLHKNNNYRHSLRHYHKPMKWHKTVWNKKHFLTCGNKLAGGAAGRGELKEREVWR